VLPSFGLSSGSMRFEPASLLLWVDADRADLRAKIARAEEVYKATGRDIINLGQPADVLAALRSEAPDVRAFVARLRHETDHLRRHLGTSYGLFYHFLNSALPPYYFDWCRSLLAETPEQLAFPLLTPSVRAMLKLARVNDFRSSNANLAAFAWASTIDLMNLLDGNPYLIDSDLAQFKLHSSFDEMATGSRVEAEKRVAFDMNPMNPETTEDGLVPFLCFDDLFCPQIFGKTFGAKHILETLAFLSEGSLAHLTGGATEEWIDSSGMAEYVLLYTFWTKFFGGGGAFASTESDSRGSVPAGINVLPTELIAALDLALWMPVGPRGLLSTGRSLTWHDFHPGWRFLRICLTLKKSLRAFQKIPDSLEVTDGLFREMQTQWCQALEWPTVEQIALEWSTFLASMIDDGKYTGFFYETGKRYPRQLSNVALVSRRIAFPYQIASNHFDFSDVALVWFPVMVARDGDLQYRPKAGLWSELDNGMMRMVTPYAVQHGNRMLVLGKQAIDHIPPRHLQMISNLLLFHSDLFHVRGNRYEELVEGFIHQ